MPQPPAQKSLESPLIRRIKNLSVLLGKLTPVPQDALGGVVGALNVAVKVGKLRLIHCTEWKRLVNAWRAAIKWTDGLETALSTMLASSMSTMFVGEQLWLKIIGPPSSGKTTLMEGLATCEEYYYSKDTIRGFHSGHRAEGGEDVSLAAQVNGKTLGIKDGDTLLRAPNLPQILAEGRALYDRVSRTHYRNAVASEYIGHRMTWQICGTSALREIDDSELGARFLDVVVMDNIDEEFEEEVGVRAAHQEALNMLRISGKDAESQYSPELAEAMAMTGGYLKYLREHAEELASNVLIGKEELDLCNRFGKFIAFMRARPGAVKSAGREERGDREFSPRLVKQLVRLAIATAVVTNKHRVEADVLHRTHKVTCDTARGITIEIAKHLHATPTGMDSRAIAMAVQGTDDRVRNMLRFLLKIHVVEHDSTHSRRYKLTQSMRRLYRGVMEHV